MCRSQNTEKGDENRHRPDLPRLDTASEHAAPPTLVIWDKDVYIMNKVFTFDAKGNVLRMENVEEFPKKKVEKPADVTTQAGMKELVGDFFSKNFVRRYLAQNDRMGRGHKSEGRQLVDPV